MPRRAGLFLRFLTVPLVGCCFLGSCQDEVPGIDALDGGGSAGESGTPIDRCSSGVICDNACVDLQQNGRNCGECGRVCPFGQTCQGGHCTCPEGQDLCDSRCVRLEEDRENCGSCATSCQGDRECRDGECLCPEHAIACDGICIDPKTDQNHCGSCGLQCGSLDACQSGVCLHRPGPTSDECGGAARNVTVKMVTANQAVQVPLYEVDDRTPARNAPLTTGRPLLVRAFLDTEPAFSPHTLAARLFLSSKSEQAVFYDKRTIRSDSTALDLNSTFNFSIKEQDLTEDLELSIEVVECQPELAEGPVLSPYAPKSGALVLGLTPSPAISIGVVPIEHEGRLPDTSGANLAVYTGALRAMFPLSSVELSVLEPMPSGQEGEVDFNLLLSSLQDRRLTDRPDPDLYYYGLVRPKATLEEHCAMGDCMYGIAYQSRSTAFHVALGVEYADQASEDTFVHELGHNMGLGHAPCGTDGDPNYPYAAAAIGSIGYDFRTQLLIDPTATKDIMSYCDPAWASDYTYRTVFATLSSSVSTNARRLPGLDRTGSTRDFLSIQLRGALVRMGPVLRDMDPPLESPEPALVLDRFGFELVEIEAFRILTGDSSLVTWLIPRPGPAWAQVVLPDGTPVALL